MENMESNLAMLNFIIGFVSPPLLSLLNQPTWSKGTKSLITIAFSVVAGFLTAYLSGNFNGVDVVSGIFITLTASIVAYKGVFKPTGVSPAIEAKTSLTGESEVIVQGKGKHAKKL